MKGKLFISALVMVCAVVSGCTQENSSAASSFKDLSTLDEKFTLPTRDSGGWSILMPSADSRLIYVSSSLGNDSTAKTYLPSDVEIGSDPFAPTGAILSYATIDAAMAMTRDGYPDYVLLLRGDSWDRTGSITLKSGRSVSEKTVLAAYGSATVRPLVKNGGVQLSDASYAAVVGIQFTATKRNPSSPDFVGFANVVNSKGFQLLSGYGGTTVGGILIEDCWFEWFSNNTVQDAVDNGGVLPYLADIVIRRNVISNNYSTVAHAQGLFSSHASILLEENVFDHNGWYQQGLNNAQTDGMATMFNHNTYFSEARETIFRRNIFSRASSIGNKFTSNTNSGKNQVFAWDILLDDNFYVEGEIGISLGGNSDQNNGPRFRNMHVTNNVMTHIGRTHPTGRSLGWGLEIIDWNAGAVEGNLFTTWGDAATLLNTYAINAIGHTTDVSYRGNVVYGVLSSGTLVSFGDGSIQRGITFVGNELNTSYTGRVLSYGFDHQESFSDNYFYSANDPSRWFSVAGVKYVTLEEYRSASGDTTSVTVPRSYVEPSRTLETYLAGLGYATDMDTFVSELKKQSRFNWRPEFTAAAINDYFRAGFVLN